MSSLILKLHLFYEYLLDYIQYILHVLKNNHKFCLNAFRMVTKYPETP